MPSADGDRRRRSGDASAVDEASRRLARRSLAAAFGPRALVIDRIETIALRAPLGRRFTGSAYSMDNRCTIVTRLSDRGRPGRPRSTPATRTSSRRSSSGSSTTSWRPRSSAGARRTRRAPGARWSRPPTTSCATAASPCRRSPALDTAIWDVFGRALGLPLHRVWGSVTDSSRSASSAATTT